MELERAAFLRDKERQQRIEEKRDMRNHTNGRTLTKEEREARIWAYMYVEPKKPQVLNVQNFLPQGS